MTAHQDDSVLPHELPVELKPLLRGWFHAVAAVVALVFAVALAWRGRGDSARLVALVVFGWSMVQLYSVSALYHIGSWKAGPRQVLNALDHANIFVQIAGTYTPICVVVLSGVFRVVFLVGIWSLALLGVRLCTFTRDAPRWVLPLLGTVMGLPGLLLLPTLLRVAHGSGFAVLLGGGALYLVGALVFAFQWPNPFPRICGYHEVFHLFALAAGACFAGVIWVWIAPLGTA